MSKYITSDEYIEKELGIDNYGNYIPKSEKDDYLFKIENDFELLQNELETELINDEFYEIIGTNTQIDKYDSNEIFYNETLTCNGNDGFYFWSSDRFCDSTTKYDTQHPFEEFISYDINNLKYMEETSCLYNIYLEIKNIHGEEITQDDLYILSQFTIGLYPYRGNGMKIYSSLLFCMIKSKLNNNFVADNDKIFFELFNLNNFNKGLGFIKNNNKIGWQMYPYDVTYNNYVQRELVKYFDKKYSFKIFYRCKNIPLHIQTLYLEKKTFLSKSKYKETLFFPNVDIHHRDFRLKSGCSTELDMHMVSNVDFMMFYSYEDIEITSIKLFLKSRNYARSPFDDIDEEKIRKSIKSMEPIICNVEELMKINIMGCY